MERSVLNVYREAFSALRKRFSNIHSILNNDVSRYLPDNPKFNLVKKDIATILRSKVLSHYRTKEDFDSVSADLMRMLSLSKEDSDELLSTILDSLGLYKHTESSKKTSGKLPVSFDDWSEKMVHLASFIERLSQEIDSIDDITNGNARGYVSDLINNNNCYCYEDVRNIAYTVFDSGALKEIKTGKDLGNALTIFLGFSSWSEQYAKDVLTIFASNVGAKVEFPQINVIDDDLWDAGDESVTLVSQESPVNKPKGKKSGNNLAKASSSGGKTKKTSINNNVNSSAQSSNSSNSSNANAVNVNQNSLQNQTTHNTKRSAKKKKSRRLIFVFLILIVIFCVWKKEALINAFGASSDSDNVNSVVTSDTGDITTSQNETKDGASYDLSQADKTVEETPVSKTIAFLTKEAEQAAINEEVEYIAEPGPYSVGGIGPAGGYIFYDIDADNTASDEDGADDLMSAKTGWRYMEAAPADISGKFNWGSNKITGAESGLGEGERNTELLIERDVAKAAAEYKHNGYDDWFLPSCDELAAMYEVLAANGLGSFEEDAYWSSTDGSIGNIAMYVDFADGSTGYYIRSSKCSVRPIRYTYEREEVNPVASSMIHEAETEARPTVESTVTVSYSRSTNEDALPAEEVAKEAIAEEVEYISEPGPYSVGGIGPAGGYIFYDIDADNTASDEDGADDLMSARTGWRYMEAAPADISGKFSWGSNKIIGAESGLGEGERNTELLIERDVAKAAAEYKYNGYDDWFLPSCDELAVMYEVLAANGLGSFEEDAYWSSTDGSIGNIAMYVDFADGSTGYYIRSSKCSVRPIRYTYEREEVNPVASSMIHEAKTEVRPTVESTGTVSYSISTNEDALPAEEVASGAIAEEVEYVAEPGPYSVGGMGPAGGYIFYDIDADNTASDEDGADDLMSAKTGWRYMEAASEDISKKSIWGTKRINNTKPGLGEGENNTKLMEGTAAATFATGYEQRGYDDWFLPSSDELAVMYEVLAANGIGGFSQGEYWSSTEDSTGNGALQINFINGEDGYSLKGTKCNVRPIRYTYEREEVIPVAASIIHEAETEARPTVESTVTVSYSISTNEDALPSEEVAKEEIAEEVEYIAEPGPYSVGGMGPAGGYIFYDIDADNTASDEDGADDLMSAKTGWRYMEAASEDISKKSIWGTSSINGTKPGLGEGEKNTKAMNNTGIASVIAGYEFGGYDDWFAPSSDELAVMYEVLAANGLGSFEEDAYWSSTEGSIGNIAMYVDFADGSTGYYIRRSKCSVRPIRYTYEREEVIPVAASMIHEAETEARPTVESTDTVSYSRSTNEDTSPARETIKLATVEENPVKIKINTGKELDQEVVSKINALANPKVQINESSLGFAKSSQNNSNISPTTSKSYTNWNDSNSVKNIGSNVDNDEIAKNNVANSLNLSNDTDSKIGDFLALGFSVKAGISSTKNLEDSYPVDSVLNSKSISVPLTLDLSLYYKFGKSFYVGVRPEITYAIPWGNIMGGFSIVNRIYYYDYFYSDVSLAFGETSKTSVGLGLELDENLNKLMSNLDLGFGVSVVRNNIDEKQQISMYVSIGKTF